MTPVDRTDSCSLAARRRSQAQAPLCRSPANACAAATPQANATADGTARRRRRRWWLLVPVAALTAVAVALGLWFFRSASYPVLLWARWGYTGTGTLTGRIERVDIRHRYGLDLSDFVSSDA